MHKSSPFQCIFSASLPTFRKGVHCTEALHPLTRAVQCAVRFSTLLVQAPLPGETVIFGTINFAVPNGFLVCFVQCCASLSAQWCSHFPCPAVLNVSSFTDDAVRAAYQKAYVPNGLKFSMLDDVDYFGVFFNTNFCNAEFPFSECSKSNMEQPEIVW